MKYLDKTKTLLNVKEGEITNLELEKLMDGAGKIKYAGDNFLL